MYWKSGTIKRKDDAVRSSWQMVPKLLIAWEQADLHWSSTKALDFTDPFTKVLDFTDLLTKALAKEINILWGYLT